MHGCQGRRVRTDTGLKQKQILRVAYPMNAGALTGPQSYGAQG